MKKKILIAIPLIILTVLLARIIFVYFNQKSEFDYHLQTPKIIELYSNDFEHLGMMPRECTGKGSGLSPSLYWTNIPKGTKSFVILVTDYDAPSPYFKLFTIDHWVVYDIPSTINTLPKGCHKDLSVARGIKYGENITGGTKYVGPNPPIGIHDYYFRIYALSKSTLNLHTPGKAAVMEAMKGSILAYGELIGKYE